MLNGDKVIEVVIIHLMNSRIQARINNFWERGFLFFLWSLKPHTLNNIHEVVCNFILLFYFWKNHEEMTVTTIKLFETQWWHILLESYIHALAIILYEWLQWSIWSELYMYIKKKGSEIKVTDCWQYNDIILSC